MTITLVWDRFKFFSGMNASRAFRGELGVTGHLFRAQTIGNGVLVAWDLNQDGGATC